MRSKRPEPPPVGPVQCKQGHEHADWWDAFRCNHDRTTPRDADGRVIVEKQCEAKP